MAQVTRTLIRQALGLGKKCWDERWVKKGEKAMSRKNRKNQDLETLLSDVGFLFELTRVMVNALRLRGGSINDLRRLLNEPDLVDKVLDLIVAPSAAEKSKKEVESFIALNHNYEIVARASTPERAVQRAQAKGVPGPMVLLEQVRHGAFVDQTVIVATPVLAENEFLVYVDYTMPHNKEALEAEFSKGGVSKLFYGNYAWQPHLSCSDASQTPGNRIMLLKHFGCDTMSEANIAKMDRLGYRPATHFEAYAFAKANPELQRQFWIVALGSSTMDSDIRDVAILRSDSERRTLAGGWFGYEWKSNCRFLFVRKDKKPDQVS